MKRAEKANADSTAAKLADNTPKASLANGSFATSTPAAATPKYQAALSSLLAKGVSPALAMQRAENAVVASAAAARADATPSGSLANGSFATSSPNAASPAYQQALSSLLAKGIPPAVAMQRANDALTATTAATLADAKNPNSAISSGSSAFFEKLPVNSDFQKSMGSSLARGVPVEVAIQKAAQADAVLQRAIKSEAASPLSGVSTGKAAIPAGNSDFDKVFASAIARGVPPADAMATAKLAMQNTPVEVPSISKAMATGKNIDSFIGSGTISPTFEKALGNALARNMSVDAAVAYAKRVEEAGALRLPLPANLAKQMSGNSSKVSVTAVSGKPLPGWLKYDPAKKAFVVNDAPPGALPMEVAVTVNGKQTVLRISDITR